MSIMKTLSLPTSRVKLKTTACPVGLPASPPPSSSSSSSDSGQKSKSWVPHWSQSHSTTWIANKMSLLSPHCKYRRHSYRCRDCYSLRPTRIHCIDCRKWHPHTHTHGSGCYTSHLHHIAPHCCIHSTWARSNYRCLLDQSRHCSCNGSRYQIEL